MKSRIAIAMSGGVDSTVAACILKDQGHNVIGIHFITGYETVSEQSAELKDSESSTAEQKVSLIADRLGIPLEIVDIREAFAHSVVEYFLRTYQAGKTPNPCMVCNPTIKFGKLFSMAQKLGASCLATGHYAGVTKDKQGRFHLVRGVDPAKEQSYFLALLTQEQLSHALFPLERMTKPQVKKIARKKDVAPLIRQESQDICFVGEGTYGEFLVRKGKIDPKPGPIENIDGKPIGQHKGLHLFTIGQRRGINCPASQPYYVVRIDGSENRLVVGHRNDLFSSECRVEGINWISTAPTDVFNAYTRIRYRHKAVLSAVYPVDDRTAIVRFKTPQSAITPGQCAVFYRGREVLGGGWIEA